MMMRPGTEIVRQYTFPGLRLVASVGEPLSPEAVRWGAQAFGLPSRELYILDRRLARAQRGRCVSCLASSCFSSEIPSLEKLP